LASRSEGEGGAGRAARAFGAAGARAIAPRNAHPLPPRPPRRLVSFLKERKQSYLSFLAARPGASFATFEQVQREVVAMLGGSFDAITVEYILDPVRPEADAAQTVTIEQYLALMASIKAFERLGFGGRVGDRLLTPGAADGKYSLTAKELAMAVFFCQ